MSLIKLAVAGAAGYAIYKYTRRDRGQAAFASGEGAPGNFAQVRNSGPDAMRDRPDGRWTRTDEASDQSFPASDPPATY
jgi:hypothetical protein